MKKEYEIEEEWVSYEIHPETPPEGTLLKDQFPGADLEAMYNRLNEAGKPYGIEFGEITLLSNSQKALEASEYAREHGKFDEMHERLFHAYFTETKDIGDVPFLLGIAEDIGLDPNDLKEALEQEKYVPVLKKAVQEGKQLEVTGTPTFLINNKYKVVGAQPIDVFRNVLEQIKEREK